ncbi:MAG: GNAT family N-acetyltransferase [Desulfobacterales bacterium]|nr:GNAT family N-acetyltransferase [Desulfobacterales bacterium]
MPNLVFLSRPNAEEVDQIIALYREAGWWTDGGDAPDLVARLVAGSHCFVAAYKEDRLVGMGRAISDRASDAYIQDVTVTEAFRGQGIGARIVNCIVDRLRADGLSWIGLIAEENSAAFYAPLGFSPMADAMPLLRKDP